MRLPLRLWLVLLSSVLAAGCAHKPPPEHAPLKKIALIPIGTPREFEVANDNFFARFWGPASLAVFVENRRKSEAFAAKMRAEQAVMGSKLQRAILEELPRQGYEVTLIDRPLPKSDDPDDIDYDTVHAEGAVLHVWIQDIGMDSPKFRSDYLPRLTVAVTLIYPTDDRPSYEEWLYYGVEAKEGKNWSVPGTPRYVFPNFEKLINNPDQVVADFDDGLEATAKHIGTELRRTLK